MRRHPVSVLAIDDQIFFKVKIQRWRGAVWVDESVPWLVAAGQRMSGSLEDFYAALSVDCRAARARYNARRTPSLLTDTYASHLLPSADDYARLKVEEGFRFVRRLEALVPELVRRSLCDGHEHLADLDTFTLGVQVRADHGHETYVAIRITGSVPGNLTLVILETVPGCDPSGWYPEAVLPDRAVGPNEQAWSNIMDTAAAAKLLDDE